MKLTLELIAETLKINAEKSVEIEGLDYYYYNSEEADKPCIVAYYRGEHRYTYLTAESFMEDHGIESLDELL